MTDRSKPPSDDPMAGDEFRNRVNDAVRRTVEIQDGFAGLDGDSTARKLGGVDGMAQALKMISRRLGEHQEPAAREALAEGCDVILAELEDRARELGRWLPSESADPSSD